MGRKSNKDPGGTKRTSRERQRKETKTTEHTVIHRTSTPKKNNEIYLQDERFDILPKTDYTYARTGSYSPRFLGRKWVNPNMSRYRIRTRRSSRIVGGNYEEESEEYTEYSDEEEEDVVNRNSSDTNSSYSTVVEDGMVLRSGHSLHSIRSVLREHESRGRRSLATNSVTSTNRVISQTMSEPRVRRYSSSQSDAVDSNRNAMTSRKQLKYDQSHSNRVYQSSIVDSHSPRTSHSRTNGNSLSQKEIDIYSGVDAVDDGGVHTGTHSSEYSHRQLNSSPVKSVRTVKKTLIEEFEALDGSDRGYEKGEMEVSEKMTRSRSRNASQRSHNIGYGYGLDSSDGEFSDTNSNNAYRRRRSASLYSSRDSASDSSSSTSIITTTTTTVITTVTETISSVTSPVLRPLWHHVGEPVCRPFWKYVGEPVWRYIGRPVWKYVVQPIVSTLMMFLAVIWFSVCDPVFYMLETVVRRTFRAVFTVVKSVFGVPYRLWRRTESMFMQLVVLDVWMLKRRKRRVCCLCLPLLLLLPILVGLFVGTDMLATTSEFVSRSRSAVAGWWGTKDVVRVVPSAVNIQENNVYLTQLNEDIQRIIVQLQDGNRNQLTTAQVEQIVRGILDSELQALRLHMEADKHSIHLNQAEWKAEQEKQLETMKQQYASLNLNIQNIQMAIDDHKAQMNVQGENYRKDSAESLSAMEEKLSALQLQLGELDKAHTVLAQRVNACCHNESYYTEAIKEQVNLILAQMMKGQMSGDSNQDTFTAWLHNNYVSREALDERMSALAADLTSSVMAMLKAQEEKQKQASPSHTFVGLGEGDGIGVEQVRLMIQEALFRYSADKTGLPDFALESAGGTVVSTRCSETYYRRTALVSVMGIPLWYTSNSPRTVIQPEVHPGQCWAFRGSQGYLVIQTSTTIVPTGFTLEHIPKALAPSGEIDSAPKQFSVIGLSSEYDTDGISLGNYTYIDEGDPIQFFPVQISNPEPYNMVELKIHSNYGNIEYTCLYRFRIHGKLYVP